MEICFFLPTRKGSQRVINKNTRPFSTIKGGLLELKLRQLLQCKNVSTVLLSTNDEESFRIANSIDPLQNKIKVILRPEDLCLDSTNLTDLINYVPTIVKENHIIWGHTTTPFITAEDYDKGIETYFSKLNEGFDSLISVMPLQNFLLNNEAKVINYNSEKMRWPRTQDLPIVYEVNHAMFIAPKSTYINEKNRIGNKPFLYEQNKIKSFDIDWEEDFLIAEAIYDKLNIL